MEAPANAEQASGLVGFLCPRRPGDPAPVAFERCFSECEEKCHPLPLLMSLASRRAAKPGIYHVTQIINPPQITVLQRQHPYYVAPSDQIWLAFGSAWHGVIEKQKKRIEEMGLSDRWIVERPFEVEIKTHAGTALLRGTPDLIQPDALRIWDFKSVKQYWVEKIRETLDWDSTTYLWQLNIYKQYAFPEATSLVLECLIKDWTRYRWVFRNKKRVRVPNKLRPIERLHVPVLVPGFIEGFVTARLAYLLQCEKDPAGVRECTPAEQWTNDRGEPVRCLDYCPTSEFCPQHKRYLEKTNEACSQPPEAPGPAGAPLSVD